MGVDCLKCINSACCKLVIEVDKSEYEELDDKVKNSFIKNTDKFIDKNPHHENKRAYLDDMYVDNYAEMKKGDDDLCVLLDRDTMLCSVYEYRPKVCRRYTSDRCFKIRELCTN